jgi:predicted enzyme related to lactoylglutathione lyase
MTSSNILLLYVTDVASSARFYSDLLGQDPAEISPTFALFILPSGLALGLWTKTGVEPAPAAVAGCCDLGFKVESPAMVDARHETWAKQGATILLPPTDLDFGRSFVAADPDGHRLRVYALANGS